MAVNPKLEEVVVNSIGNLLSETNPAFKVIYDLEREKSQQAIRNRSNIMIDTDYKLRMHILNFIAYGYDLTKQTGTGESADAVYKRAVELTQKMSGKPHLEQFQRAGVEGNFGWYITKIG